MNLSFSSVWYFFAVLAAICFGTLSSAGVFTVFAAVGLVPRLVGRTHTAKHVACYENMIIAGAVFGCLLSVIPECLQLGRWIMLLPQMRAVWPVIGHLFLGAIGSLSGMFVGCLALAIAESLDSIPILARRIHFRKGLPAAVCAMALGKVAGALFYFLTQLNEV